MRKNDLVLLFSVIFILTLTMAATNCSVPEVKPKVEVVKSLPTLAWGDKPWTKILMDAIDAKSWDPGIVSPCKKVEFKICLAQAISKMAEYESGFKPETKYVESFKDAKGANVVSRGLFQLSIESSNQSAYKCGIKVADELHDADTNIKCMVNIAHYWLNKDKVFFGGEKLGLGRYHSVARVGSKSNAKILKYLEQF